jgi:chemotaxis protein histidine kinase CheA
MPKSSQSDGIAALTQAFSASLPQRVAEIDDCWQQLQRDWDPVVMTQLGKLCHGLAGTAGSFGHGDVGECARQIEIFIRMHREKGELIDDDKQQQITRLLQSLKTLTAAN